MNFEQAHSWQLKSAIRERQVVRKRLRLIRCQALADWRFSSAKALSGGAMPVDSDWMEGKRVKTRKVWSSLRESDDWNRVISFKKLWVSSAGVCWNIRPFLSHWRSRFSPKCAPSELRASVRPSVYSNAQLMFSRGMVCSA